MLNTARMFSVFLVLFVAACFLEIVSAAASKRTDAVARVDVRQLLQLMDKDKNGTVSKDEFLRYMEYIFDELDSNANGELDAGELGPFTSANFTGCNAMTYQKILIVGQLEEHRRPGAGPAAWKQFMDTCLAGKVH